MNRIGALTSEPEKRLSIFSTAERCRLNLSALCWVKCPIRKFPFLDIEPLIGFNRSIMRFSSVDLPAPLAVQS
jgi:hypothetical protein